MGGTCPRCVTKFAGTLAEHFATGCQTVVRSEKPGIIFKPWRPPKRRKRRRDHGDRSSNG